MPPATFKFDDTFAFVRPVQEGRTQVAYPFITNGDRGTRTYSRTLLQREANYVPAVLGFERDSVWEGGDPAAFLISETSPEPTGIGDLVRFTRTYARLPAQQTVYASRLIDRPVMHDITAGGYYAVSFDNGVTSHVFSARTAASLGSVDIPYDVVGAKQGSLPAATVTIGKNAGGTFTFSTSDSGSTIQAAFASAFGSSCYCARSDRGISVTGASLAIKYVDVSGTGIATSLSGGISVNQELDISVDLGTANATSTRRVTTSIAATVGSFMALWNGDKLVAWGKVVATNGSTYSDIELSEVPGANLVANYAAVAGVTASTRYVNGPANCTVKEVTDFYLPGVTTGITTPADIALVAPKLDPVSWLTAIQAGTTYVVTEGSQLSRWLGGPIYSQTTVSVQMSDALDTVAVGA